MSDLNQSSKGSTMTTDQAKVLETASQIVDKGDGALANALNATYANCDDDNDDDDNDVIFVKTKKGCEHERLEATNTGSTLLLNDQLEKIHIDSKDSTVRSSNTSVITEPQECSYIHSDGTKPKVLRSRAQTNPTTKAGEKPLNNDCENLKKYNCIKGSGVSHSAQIKNGNSLPPPELPIPIRNAPKRSTDSPPKPIQMSCPSKQNLPTLLKSQSLDLYNEDCAILGIDQLHNRLLPDINEYRSTDSQIQPTSNEGMPPGSSLDNATGDARQRPTCRPNIATAIFQSTESRPIYPNVPYSPYGSPYGSPRAIRRRPPLRESRRISIEKSGSFLQLNQYKLMDQIGQGSYGLVKLAYSEEDSTHYAMKILSKKRLLRQAALMRRGPKQTTSPLDRVYREIAVLKKLDHPNIVKLVEVLDDPIEDSLYMVFELVKKGEVLSIPTDKPMPEERAWSVLRDCLLGLEYLHYQKIIHADLKPGNLLLTECGHVKIADLGVCNEFLGEDAIMSNGSTLGTPAFRAPETLALGKNVYCGRAADIWALGATLYSLVYGNVPFVANSIPLLYEKIKNDAVVFPEIPKISREMRDCIVAMLEKDAAHRITLPQLKVNPWVTRNGSYPLPSEDENCFLVQIDDEDINSVVRSIPKLDTLILIKTMLKNHSFGNPFVRGISGKAPQPGGSRLEKFIQAGRSNSAPGSYHMTLDRQPSTDSALPSLTEHCSNQNNEEL